MTNTDALNYSIMDPTGNITALVESYVDICGQPYAASQIMARHREVEQVGFVNFEDISFPALRMAGGEFCGNASLSAAALYMKKTGKQNGTVRLQVSGADHPVTVQIHELSTNQWSGTVEMPEPVSIRSEILPDGAKLPVVRFPGIAHIILEDERYKNAAEELAPLWCQALNVPALGLMFFDRSANALAPLVYVKEPGTLFWESSCASGTTAVGAWMYAKEKRPLILSLLQKGGILRIEAQKNGRLLLSGNVRIVCQTQASVFN